MWPEIETGAQESSVPRCVLLSQDVGEREVGRGGGREGEREGVGERENGNVPRLRLCSMRVGAWEEGGVENGGTKRRP